VAVNAAIYSEKMLGMQATSENLWNNNQPLTIFYKLTLTVDLEQHDNNIGDASNVWEEKKQQSTSCNQKINTYRQWLPGVIENIVAVITPFYSEK